MRIKSLALFAILIAVVPLLVTGCSPKAQEIVATVGENPITLKEYETLYLKGNGNRDSAVASGMQDREHFLDLMVNYKLKLADAQRMKLDQRPEIVNEIQQYKGGLAASFITEREITGPGIRRLYDRKSEEIRSSHILLTLNPKASPEDSAKAYAKGYEIIKALKAGGDFKTLALENSQDPSVKQNGGDLYYVTGGQMIPAFEDAIFSMKVGEISSAPLRTQFGLHIIKVIDRRPAPGEIRCSHIMVRFPTQNPTPQDTATAFAKIKALEDSLKLGVAFAGLATRNSEDPGSAPKGGDLGWFQRRRWVQPFDEVAFQLKPGQVSGIVRTPYGYHLIMCTDTKPRKTFDESKQELQQTYQQTAFQQDYAKLLEKLEKQVNVRRNGQLLKEFLATADSTKLVRDSSGTANVPAKLLKSELASVGPISLTLDSVLSVMRYRQDLATTTLRELPFASAMDKIIEQLVWTVAADSLERQYPEFASILKEYKEGVLLYQVEQDNVWNKVAPNDSVLHAYFDAHRDKFTLPDRVDFSELRLPTEPIARTILAQVKEGKTLEEIAAADSARMAAPTQFEGTFKKGSTALAPKSKTTLTTVAKELQADSTLKVQVTVHPDTGKAKSKKLAASRLETVSAQLRKLGLRPDRIITVTHPLAGKTLVANASGKAAASVNTTKEADAFELNIVGRQALVLGSVERAVLAPSADERARNADGLAVGAVSNPIPFRSTFSLVRLNKREPARQKTFEEAGGEVSSAFQEAESKRLETEWLQSLRKQYPVVEYKEVLKDAFVRR
jgi:peptidyl-prolyl cis-trans isomerase SurA